MIASALLIELLDVSFGSTGKFDDDYLLVDCVKRFDNTLSILIFILVESRDYSVPPSVNHSLKNRLWLSSWLHFKAE